MYRTVKRIIDISISTIALILLSPALLFISVMIKLDNPGPVFYIAQRIGLHGKVFRMYKFRTMVVGADKKGSWQTSLSDSRITKLGALLRKYSIDEIPQIINVLSGHMSLIGPRPIDPRQKEEYSAWEFKVRHSVLPGVTGLAQVAGRSYLTHAQAVHYDLEYCCIYSLEMDIKIILRTIKVVLTGKGSW